MSEIMLLNVKWKEYSFPGFVDDNLSCRFEFPDGGVILKVITGELDNCIKNLCLSFIVAKHVLPFFKKMMSVHLD